MLPEIALSITLINQAWLAVALAGALAVIAVMALIYELSPLVGRNELRPWARIKIFDTLFAILLIFILFVVVSVLTSINYSSLLGKNLVPNRYASVFVGSSSVPSNCIPATDIYSLSMCDLDQFEGYASQLNNVAYVIQFFLLISSSKQLQHETNWFTFSGTLSTGFSSFQNLLMLSLFFALYMLIRVLLLLLAIAPLLLGVMLAIGLVARIFPVTRTFGGAMIAFGLGIGLLLPIMIAITYGYLDVALQNTWSAFASTFTSNLVNLSSILLLIITVGASAVGTLLISMVETLLEFAGMVVVGLAVISMFDITIVDVFISDFSQAVGEKLDFMSILTSVI